MKLLRIGREDLPKRVYMFMPSPMRWVTWKYVLESRKSMLWVMAVGNVVVAGLYSILFTPGIIRLFTDGEVLKDVFSSVANFAYVALFMCVYGLLCVLAVVTLYNTARLIAYLVKGFDEN